MRTPQRTDIAFGSTDIPECHTGRSRRRRGRTWTASPISMPRPPARPRDRRGRPGAPADRKSTRLNSSHVAISYAVFCLKKKKPVQEREGEPFKPFNDV